MPSTDLAIYRRRKGYTQEQLSELSGVTTRTIQRIEKGTVVPHTQTLKMLAEHLEIDMALLMDPEELTVPPATPKPGRLLPLFHLLGLAGLLLPVLNVILPFSLWLFKREENPEYNRQGKQVINFQLTMTILFFPSIVLMVYFFPVGFPLTMFLYLFMVIMSLVNLFRSAKSSPVNYPISYPFFRL